MRRSLGEVAIVVLLALATIKSLLSAQRMAVADGPLVETVLLLALAWLGILGVSAVWRRTDGARRLVGWWALILMLRVVVPDLALGFARPGMEARLLATLFVAAVLAAVVVSVPARAARTT